MIVGGRMQRALLDFGDLHGLVDGQGGVANRGIWWRGGVAGDGFEVAGGAAVERVGVAIALGLAHRDRVGGDEFVDVGAVIVEGQEATLGLRDLEEIAANAGQADRLCGRGAGVSGRQLLQRVFVDDEGYPCKDQKRG